MFRRLLVPVLISATVLAACGDDPVSAVGTDDATPTASASANPTREPDDALGGFAIAAQTVGEFGNDPGRLMTGELVLAPDGCWSIAINGTDRLVVFPPGFVFAENDTTTIEDRDGQQFSDGAAVDGSAHFVFADGLPGGPDGKWGNYLDYCRPDLAELVVFEQMVPAFDPSTLSPSELHEMAASATFTDDWPCGRGFAVSTADQQVAIFIYETTGDRSAELVALPDPGWSADLVVGKHLFVQHCDDAIEEWEPEPIEAARWSITGGELALLTDIPTAEGESAAVRALLRNATVQTDHGEIALPDLELENAQYNFFAG